MARGSEVIWVLMTDYCGGFYEGGHCHSVYATKEKAIQGAEKWMRYAFDTHTEIPEHIDDNGKKHKAYWFDSKISNIEWKNDETELWFEVITSSSDSLIGNSSCSQCLYAYLDEKILDEYLEVEDE